MTFGFHPRGHIRRMSEEPEADPRDPAPFVPDETDAPRDPDTGAIRIDEPDVGDGEQEPDQADDEPPL
jgi:hypothetical protein